MGYGSNDTEMTIAYKKGTLKSEKNSPECRTINKVTPIQSYFFLQDNRHNQFETSYEKQF
jgi:hypothetical protein